MISIVEFFSGNYLIKFCFLAINFIKTTDFMFLYFIVILSVETLETLTICLDSVCVFNLMFNII